MATPVPSILVSGTGEVHADPDRATVRLGVTAQEPTAREAQRRTNAIGQAILDAVIALGIPEERIQTTRLMLDPVYDHGRPDQRSEPRIVGYRASNVVAVELEDLSKIGPAIDAAIGAGANNVEGVDFRLDDDRDARREALNRAVAEARSQAQTIAGALDVELGPVLEAQEGGVSTQPPDYPPRPMMAMRAEMDVATPVSPGQVILRASVTVRYRIGHGGP